MSTHHYSPPSPAGNTTATAEEDTNLAQSGMQAMGRQAAEADAINAAMGDEGMAKLAELEAKNAELAELYLRAQAEVQNTHRRADEEVAKARKFALESFAESLLPVLDSLEAGLATPNANVEQMREGMDATLRQLSAALERNKITQINPDIGAKFDPHIHQAISTVAKPEGSQQDSNTIVSVLQKGYTISERVLRPALVTVAT